MLSVYPVKSPSPSSLLNIYLAQDNKNSWVDDIVEDDKIYEFVDRPGS